jgi:transposase-like protein
VWQGGGVKRPSAQFRTTRRHLTPKEKAELFEEHRRSGLSLLGFAEKHGLCYSSLLRWRCRQGNGANVAEPPDTEADPRFVPVKIEGEVLGGDYVLSWATGRSLRIPRQFETDSLRRLLSVLEARR